LSVSRTGRINLGEGVSGTHWIGDWMGARAGLDVVTKTNIPFPCRETNPDRPVPSLAAVLTELPCLQR